MTKTHWIIWIAALGITIVVSIFWHVFLFEKAYLDLGVYTRMGNPIYEFGFAAWLVESTAFVAIYFQTRWASEGIFGGIKFALLMAAFIAATLIMGSAAKIQISDIDQWLMLSGGFLLLHFLSIGIAIGWLNRGMK